jgi:hypothetical protein
LFATQEKNFIENKKILIKYRIPAVRGNTAGIRALTGSVCGSQAGQKRLLKTVFSI